VILRNCRRAMHADGKVLIVERMIFDDPEKSLPTLLSDLNMPVLTGGRERTEEEYARLLVPSRRWLELGWRSLRVVQLK
jgi:O-methyltransferase domain